MPGHVSSIDFHEHNHVSSGSIKQSDLTSSGNKVSGYELYRIIHGELFTIYKNHARSDDLQNIMNHENKESYKNKRVFGSVFPCGSAETIVRVKRVIWGHFGNFWPFL